MLHFMERGDTSKTCHPPPLALSKRTSKKDPIPASVCWSELSAGCKMTCPEHTTPPSQEQWPKDQPLPHLESQNRGTVWHTDASMNCTVPISVRQILTLQTRAMPPCPHCNPLLSRLQRRGILTESLIKGPNENCSHPLQMAERPAPVENGCTSSREPVPVSHWTAA